SPAGAGAADAAPDRQRRPRQTGNGDRRLGHSGRRPQRDAGARRVAGCRMMDRFSRDLTFGAQYLGRGRTRFRFWAPSQKNVRLILGGGEIAMAAQPGGWFAVEAECGPGTRYRFRLDDGMAVPDPASRAQAEGVHGPSVVVDPLAYTWRNPNWRGRPWRETVLYELHAGA